MFAQRRRRRADSSGRPAPLQARSGSAVIGDGQAIVMCGGAAIGSAPPKSVQLGLLGDGYTRAAAGIGALAIGGDFLSFSINSMAVASSNDHLIGTVDVGLSE